ncbi:hypothetical protein TSUD_33620, partial [Trifolium subterraneum]
MQRCTVVLSFVQSNATAGGCVPADTPTLKSVEAKAVDGQLMSINGCRKTAEEPLMTLRVRNSLFVEHVVISRKHESLCSLVVVEVHDLQDFRGEGRDLKGQVASSSSATCKGYREDTQVPIKVFLNYEEVSWPLWINATILIMMAPLEFVQLCYLDFQVFPSPYFSDLIQVPVPSSKLSLFLHYFQEQTRWLRVINGGMAGDDVQRRITVEDNIDWVADDPRTTPSKFEFEEEFPEDFFTEIEDLDSANREVRIPGARQRICSTFRNGGFPMYQIAFEHIGLCLPGLRNCSSVSAVVAHHFSIFHLFAIQRSRPRGNMTDKCGWVSLIQHNKFFEIFEESLRGFKDKWFVVRPITSEGWKTIIVRGPKVDGEGKIVLGPNGKPIEVDCEHFPFCWSTKHYSREAKSFTFKKRALSKEELVDLKALEDFVDGFPPSLWEDREGRPICDEEGHQLLSKKFINTKALLKCTTRPEANDLLRMFNTTTSLRKLQAEKKKREVGGASSSTINTSAQSSPSRSIDLTGEKRVLEGVPGDKRTPKSARTDGGGSSVVGGHKHQPGRPAVEFVLPPVMGHECLLDGKTVVKLAPAEETILASMGPESIKNVVAESSVAVFKLLQVATFLNGRECKYLQER